MISPKPPSKIITIAKSKNISGLPDFNATIARKIPIARDPASPIKSLLGVALYQRYPRSDTVNKRIRKLKSSSTPNIVFNTKKETIEIIASVPDNPSTPSVQFVTLIAAHTKITVRIAKIIGGMVILTSSNAITISLVL